MHFGLTLVSLCALASHAFAFLPGLFGGGGIGGAQSSALDPFSSLFGGQATSGFGGQVGGSNDLTAGDNPVPAGTLPGSGSAFDSFSPSNMLSGVGSSLGGLLGGASSSLGNMLGGASSMFGNMFSPAATGPSVMDSLLPSPFGSGMNMNPVAGMGVQLFTGNKMCTNPVFLRRCNCNFFCPRGTVDYGQCEDHRENSFLPKFCCPDSIHLMCVGME